MRPSPVLCGRIKNRLRFTTKNVGRGFYRGTGTGALGAHTQYGNYLIDWRRVRHYVMPDLKDSKLTPFVSGNIYKDYELPIDNKGNPYDPKKVDGAQYLKWWMDQNTNEVEWLKEKEREGQEEELQSQQIEEQKEAVPLYQKGTNAV